MPAKGLGVSQWFPSLRILIAPEGRVPSDLPAASYDYKEIATEDMMLAGGLNCVNPAKLFSIGDFKL